MSNEYLKLKIDNLEFKLSFLEKAMNHIGECPNCKGCSTLVHQYFNMVSLVDMNTKVFSNVSEEI